MKIESIRLKNFKVFKQAEMRDIPNLCVIVGTNSSGKSTFFSVFKFLKEAMNSNIRIALAQLGGTKGLREIRSRNAIGPVEIEIKFREKKTSPLITYFLAINEENGQPVVEQEILKYRRGSKGQPWHFIEFSKGKGKAVTNEIKDVSDETELNREEHILKSPDILALKGLALFQRFPAAMALGSLIENWHLSDLHINSAKMEQIAGYSEHLSIEGENLALVTDFIYKNHPDIFKRILKNLSLRIPGIKNIQAKTTEEGRILLTFKDGSFKDPFLARFVSDGTIKMLAYLILLHDPKPHHLLCVEEPENQFYPKLLWELAEDFRMYSNRGGQVFVSTHSPDFLNALKIDEVFWLVKENGYTNIKRAKHDEQIAVYTSEGDQMGYLWKQGFFKGADPI